MINKTFFAKPTMSTDGKLLGVELCTQFHNVVNSKYYFYALSIEQKQRLLVEQLDEIKRAASWFRDYSLYCSLHVDKYQARLCAFDGELKDALRQIGDIVRLEVSEDESIDYGINKALLKSLSDNGNTLFLTGLGAGRATLLTTKHFHTVKLDRAFYHHEVQKPTFEILIKNIKRFCDRIIVDGVDQRDELALLREINVWGIQGDLYRSVPFLKVHTLL
ncbi:MAG: hypothetical protein K0S95_740 [Pantoea eucrina]|jgi:EAL domain-containing protein (putative c-di-GMP-specific phosphodiesterase class I)|nr:hypothetical protein [Pantoea eucrina]